MLNKKLMRNEDDIVPYTKEKREEILCDELYFLLFYLCGQKSGKDIQKPFRIYLKITFDYNSNISYVYCTVFIY